MKSIALEKLLFAKRQAMNLYFNVVCPLDDDDGFDRFLMFKSADEMVGNPEWGEIHLLESSAAFSLEQLQRVVRSEAIRTLCTFLDITPDVAASALARVKTLGSGATGLYTRCKYDGVLFE
ncbi:hypothetical protein C6Q04_30140 [Burkholderia multivorans]|uniref:hypothetical protein n=1 Tax=Burkholderia cepacia complex TaxID=87882 RepID=UPI00018E38DB|nr:MULTISPECIES: hypothetical protein [Burkholderia cepacia complex]EED97282.1 conserved hypothetical protein [Burkholderia multivorans CGD1]MBJ9624936.1 hypothetical protein [Burkholderia multivorans]MCA8464017.1 hypothetical protein [Burkholderia multivorans]MDN7436876.1 hypothetical protein [Burkholderia multivorans]PRE30460.1 hypothetical protein C6P79_06515 [Burkholderia multivorans]